MKKTDFQIKKGIVPYDFTRGVQINGKASVLTVKMTFNNKKGLIKVTPQITHDQITGNEDDDAATLETLSELAAEAIKKGLELRRDWDEARKDEDPDQLSIGFDTKQEEGQPAPK